MEKNQSPRTFNKKQGTTNARLNKKESSHLANNVKKDVMNDITDNSVKLSMKQQFRKFFKSIGSWFGFGKYDRDTIDLGSSGTIKRTNKEAKRRSPEVRAKRNTARNSRKTNGHRGNRVGK